MLFLITPLLWTIHNFQKNPRNTEKTPRIWVVNRSGSYEGLIIRDEQQSSLMETNNYRIARGGILHL